jgi:ferric-dicitrate binding protein FerR (iron transport regulator)
MNTDNSIESLIVKFLSGQASAEEKELLISWIKESPENRLQFKELQNIWQGLNPPFDPNEIEVEAVRKGLLKKINKRLWQQHPLMIFWQRTAAILIIPLILTVIYLLASHEPEKVTFQEIFAPYGTYTQVNLPDDSKVWLNAGSSIKYPTRFKKGSREVSLNGEAYFEVESDRKNPFTVHTSHVDVRATGTVFNVEAYPTDSIASVTMVRGKLGITMDNQSQIGLIPGERASFNKNTLQCRIEKTDPYKWYAWKDGLMVFRDDPLEYVFKRLGQTFNVEIKVMDKEIANQLYRATFREESLSEILRLLKLTAPIRYVDYEQDPASNTALRKRKVEVYKID